MNSEEKIILYLDNQLNDSEKTLFEEELKNSQELQKIFEDYKTLYSNIEETKNVDVDNSYFTNIVPGFRKRLENNDVKSYLPKITYALTSIIILFIFASILFMNRVPETTLTDLNKIGNEDDLIVNYYEPVYYEISEMYNDEINDSLLDKEISDQLSLQDVSLVSYAEDYEDIVNNISPAEAEKVYNELINKRYF